MQNISADDAYQLLEQPDNIFIDVRTPGEFSSEHIERAINLPLDSIADTIEKALPDKSKALFLYCLSGSRSMQAAKIAEHLGYKNIYNIQSGLLAWRMKKLPLVKK